MSRPIDYSPKKKTEVYKPFSKTGGRIGINKSPVVSDVYVRSTTNHPSKVTPGGSTPLKEIPLYTGDKLRGISIIHKSHLAPIFSKEEAVDVASMRR